MLQQRGVSPDRLIVPRSAEYDLTDELQVRRLFRQTRPDVVIHLAAEVGGIGANLQHPGRFFFANLAMGLHLIEQARLAKIRKFVQTGTVCAYPKFAPVPFREEQLWDGYPEETNAPYGVAKKSLFVMLDAYHRQYGLASAVVVPVNLYGPGDNFDPASSHVIPALIRKCHAAARQNEDNIVCWGTGRASREFLYVDDAARGIVAAAELMDEPTPINLGTGREIGIADLAKLITAACGFQGRIAGTLLGRTGSRGGVWIRARRRSGWIGRRRCRSRKVCAGQSPGGASSKPYRLAQTAPSHGAVARISFSSARHPL